MVTQQAVLKHREQILLISERHGATNVRVFGSVARGTAGPESDLDLPVDVGPNRSPWFPVGLTADLADLLGCSIDVATDDSLHRRIRDRMLLEARPL